MYAIIAMSLLLGVTTDAAQGSTEGFNDKAFRRLWEASQEGDRSVYPLVEDVLLDMAEQRYRYLKEVRLVTFDYIDSTSDRRVIPWLQKIAMLPSAENDALESILDAYAIRGALRALAEFETEDVVPLSRRHVLGHPLVRTVAVRNLARLRAWQATEDVKHLLCSTPPVEDHHVELAVAAAFLDESPKTEPTICSCLQEINQAFEKEFSLAGTDPLYDFFADLNTSLRSLASRLEC